MINPNVKTLENIIFTYVITNYKKEPPTEEKFLEVATSLRNCMAPMQQVSDDEFVEIISRLKQKLVIQMDIGVYINDRNYFL